jgi:hypothetical protein
MDYQRNARDSRGAILRTLRLTFTPIRLLGLLAFIALALAAACGGDDSNTPTPSTSGGATASTGSGGPTRTGGAGSGSPVPTVTEVRTAICTPADKLVGLVSQVAFNQDGLYKPGETVDMTFTVGNCGDNDATLHFSTAQRYDFHITDSVSGTEVWSAQDGKTFEQTIGTEVIAPNTEISYNEKWDQKDRSGNQVPEGDYKVSTMSIGCGVEGQTQCGFGTVRDIIISSTLPSPSATP